MGVFRGPLVEGPLCSPNPSPLTFPLNENVIGAYSYEGSRHQGADRRFRTQCGRVERPGHQERHGRNALAFCRLTVYYHVADARFH